MEFQEKLPAVSQCLGIASVGLLPFPGAFDALSEPVSVGTQILVGSQLVTEVPWHCLAPAIRAASQLRSPASNASPD